MPAFQDSSRKYFHDPGYPERIRTAQTDWEAIDRPVLAWIKDQPLDVEWQFNRGDEPSDEIPSISNDELDLSLRRLMESELVVGKRYETSGFYAWTHLRISAGGLRILGEWPPVQGADVSHLLCLMLEELAEDAPEGEARWYRRAAGAVTRFGTAVLTNVLMSEARRGGGELAP